MTHRERKAALEALLLAYQFLWRPQPFRAPEPDWCTAHPALAQEALAVDAASLEARAAETTGLVVWLARHFPDLAGLVPLLQVPPCPTHLLPASSGRLDWGVPGRKRAQIEAYAAALGRPVGPVVEWCAGKGHLGRLLAGFWKIPVTSLEIDRALCAAGTALARHGHLETGQSFVQADALDPASACHLRGRHALALHACGDLHRSLIAGAVEQASPALDLAPCCYHRTLDECYRPFCGGSLQLNHDDLRLAVTDTMTASPRLRHRSRRAMAWKLAFQALACGITGQDYHPLKPVPETWLTAGFETWCRRLADREGLPLPAHTDWQRLEAEGERSAARMRRLELVRLAFRRALELWLVTDMAVYLEEHGHRVELGTFCAPALTPRNLLLSARRA